MASIDRGRRDLTALLIGLASAAVAVAFSFTTPARNIENLTYDLRMALAAPPPEDGLVIVKMDDRAVDEMRISKFQVALCMSGLVRGLWRIAHRRDRAAGG